MPLPDTPPQPGPAAYDLVDYEGPTKHYMSSSAFVSTTSRWTGNGPTGELPGPGEFDEYSRYGYQMILSMAMCLARNLTIFRYICHKM